MTDTQKEMYTAIVERMIENLMKPQEEEAPLKEDAHGRAMRDKKPVDYSIFLDEKEYANSDDKFEEYVRKVRDSFCYFAIASFLFSSYRWRSIANL